MKFSEQWLREWLPGCDAVSAAQLSAQLTNLGLEVDDWETHEGEPNNASITIKVPANRGDCFGILGIARDVAAGLQLAARQPFTVTERKPTSQAGIAVKVLEQQACPCYGMAMISGITAAMQAPAWIIKRLEQSGVRQISGIVDIVNYVMLELGQPMHAFDRRTLSGDTLFVRYAKPDETLTLLDGTSPKLKPNTLVIADAKGPQAIAGIMGGASSGVTTETTEIVLESAYFEPVGIRLTARQYGLRTDAVQRFERGVDPALAQQALQRAVDLILEYGGGQLEGLNIQTATAHLPKPITVALRFGKVKGLLGYEIPKAQIPDLLSSLKLSPVATPVGWEVTIPPHRFDIAVEADLIEELARLHGLDHVPSILPCLPLQVPVQEKAKQRENQIKNCLIARGYQEVITYSFIDPVLAEVCTEDKASLALLNPISSEKSVMRESLLPGLLLTLQNHQRYGGTDGAFFETGLCFEGSLSDCRQPRRLAGVVEGSPWASQWGISPRLARDFFTLKADIEACLGASLLREGMLRFEPTVHPSFHPSEAAQIVVGKQIVGVVGSIHPRIQKHLDCAHGVVAFEIELGILGEIKPPAFEAFSKFPRVHRDLALLVKEEISAGEIESAIATCVTDKDWVFKQKVFDVYRGKPIAPGYKSLGLTLSFQHSQRTLVEEEINTFMEAVLEALLRQYGIQLRD